MPENELAFRTNANKDYLRSVYDRRIIEAWGARVGHTLNYLGLPGPEMLDIVEWEPFLDRFSTIERRENEQHLLYLRANVKDLEHRLHSLYGEFDDILIKGRDEYGHAPKWPYDLVNLDFFGGFLYRDLSRPRSLAKLIENQDNHGRSFLLIISYHLRDGDFTGEKLAFLDDLSRKLSRDLKDSKRVSEPMEWYRSGQTPDAARQTLYLNAFLHDHGEAHRFHVACRPAVVYSGTGGARMIHFVTEFQHQGRAHRAVSPQSLVDVVDLGYVELRDRKFVEPVEFPRLGG